MTSARAIPGPCVRRRPGNLAPVITLRPAGTPCIGRVSLLPIPVPFLAGSGKCGEPLPRCVFASALGAVKHFTHQQSHASERVRAGGIACFHTCPGNKTVNFTFALIDVIEMRRKTKIRVVNYSASKLAHRLWSASSIPLQNRGSGHYGFARDRG
jgi:hypothetical protein